MTPRAYTLGRRADSAAATRQRIVNAAMEIYSERGIASTNLQAVAERADVSRGTILHHFGTADGLIDAVAQTILAKLELPDEQILDGIADPDERIRTFIDAMVRFFKRSASWWPIFEAEMERPALKAREQDYWLAVGRLQAAALGPEVMANRLAVATIGALVNPSTLGALIWSLESAGLDSEEIIRVIGELAVSAAHRVSVTLVER